MRKSVLGAIVFATILASGHAYATDQGVTGKKLLLKDTPKFVLLSKDPTISILGSDPVNGADSSLTFDDGNGPVTFSLPKAGWSASGSGFKYKNALAPGGPSVVKIAKLKSGKLKVVGKGLPFPVPVGGAVINVVLSLDGGTNSYCMTFFASGDGSKYLSKDQPAGTCVPPQTCGNDAQEGTEQCDGSDDSSCPGACLGDCTCNFSARICCEFGGSVCGGRSISICTFQGGSPGPAGSVCDATGNCVPGPGTPGDCCAEFLGCLMPIAQNTCEVSFFGVFTANATCSPSGTCISTQTCGNNLREGTEACDGSDDTACPGDCLGDCTCAMCSETTGDATACSGFSALSGACFDCCMNDSPCLSACYVAVLQSCGSSSDNDACSAAANAASCAAECCP